MVDWRVACNCVVDDDRRDKKLDVVAEAESAVPCGSTSLALPLPLRSCSTAAWLFSVGVVSSFASLSFWTISILVVLRCSRSAWACDTALSTSAFRLHRAEVDYLSGLSLKVQGDFSLPAS